MKILEILIHEDEVCNAEYFAVEEHRKKLDVTRWKIEEFNMPAVGDEKEKFIADSHAHKECLKLPNIELRKLVVKWKSG